MHLVITYDRDDQQLANVKSILPGAKITALSNKELTPEIVSDAEIIFGWPAVELLPAARELRWLQLPSAGADGYVDQALYCQDDIVVTNGSGIYGKPIAEHVLS